MNGPSVPSPQYSSTTASSSASMSRRISAAVLAAAPFSSQVNSIFTSQSFIFFSQSIWRLLDLVVGVCIVVIICNIIWIRFSGFACFFGGWIDFDFGIMGNWAFLY
ncbi:hypothetical protein Drorol1_Dr00021240 [Drosera rotundifolia]